MAIGGVSCSNCVNLLLGLGIRGLYLHAVHYRVSIWPSRCLACYSVLHKIDDISMTESLKMIKLLQLTPPYEISHKSVIPKGDIIVRTILPVNLNSYLSYSTHFRRQRLRLQGWPVGSGSSRASRPRLPRLLASSTLAHLAARNQSNQSPGLTVGPSPSSIPYSLVLARLVPGLIEPPSATRAQFYHRCTHPSSKDGLLDHDICHSGSSRIRGSPSSGSWAH